MLVRLIQQRTYSHETEKTLHDYHHHGPTRGCGWRLPTGMSLVWLLRRCCQTTTLRLTATNAINADSNSDRISSGWLEAGMEGCHASYQGRAGSASISLSNNISCCAQFTVGDGKGSWQ